MKLSDQDLDNLIVEIFNDAASRYTTAPCGVCKGEGRVYRLVNATLEIGVWSDCFVCNATGCERVIA